MERIGGILGSLDRGKAIPSQKNIEPDPELTLEERKEELRKSLRVASLSNTFENFLPVAGSEKALAAAKALAEGVTNKQLLLCYGGVGNGKTHLCEAMAIALYKRHIFCRVMPMPVIVHVLKEMKAHSLGLYEEILNRFCYANHLIIDDVGLRGSVSDGEKDWDVRFEYAHLEEIMLVRYREHLFTFMTTNRDLTELPERVVSRFSDPDVGMLVLNSGEDYRGLKERE